MKKLGSTSFVFLSVWELGRMVGIAPGVAVHTGEENG